MQVTCPNCGARYAVDPLAIGPAGRIVQCARCAHRWMQGVDVTPIEPEDLPVPDLVIRPPSRGAGLPAVIEPKSRLGLTLLIAALALIVALGAGAYVFREEILPLVPAEMRPLLAELRAMLLDWWAAILDWRSLLPFDL